MTSNAATAEDEGVVLVTGATGFVGARLMQVLGTKAAALYLRSAPESWPAALQGKHSVVHLAARVHLMQDDAVSPMVEYHSVNVELTLALARMAASAGVHRFVFISSIKVNGEKTEPGHPFRADDVPAPQDPYGISKWQAEQGLRKLAEQTGLEIVIIRPPLVYGPGVKANFAALVNAVAKGWPLPLGSICNQRSLVALDNLVDFIACCVQHPKAANQTFLISDGCDLSTPELVRQLAHAAGVTARLPRIPVELLKMAASLLGKKGAVERLSDNLQVNISKAQKLLQWVPPLTVAQGLEQVVQGRKTS